jgi:ABC-type Fe3+/spermidine/putrescine transport system ATPase subunit
MVQVRLEKVTKRFDDVVAVDDVNIKIKDGEFFTLLGPSGCGKTTTMRLIAGLEFPTIGKIYFDDIDVTEVPSFERNTGMVFQNYALWPHMTVRENVRYGLEVRKLPKAEIIKRVDEILNLVELEGMGNRFPSQLSGGQQQRVALARVLVINPGILLFDEPLSNLDAKLRVEMREEIKEIQRKLGITTVYVTHDQEEAMAVSDRLAIQNKGRIIQVGTPQEVYNVPINMFIATFIGKGVFLEGIVDSINDFISVKVEDFSLKGVSTQDYHPNLSDHVVCMMRSENLSLSEIDEPSNVIEGEVEWCAFVGSTTEIKLSIGNEKLVINVRSDRNYEPREKLVFYVPQKMTTILPWMKLD